MRKCWKKKKKKIENSIIEFGHKALSVYYEEKSNLKFWLNEIVVAILQNRNVFQNYVKLKKKF